MPRGVQDHEDPDSGQSPGLSTLTLHLLPSTQLSLQNPSKTKSSLQSLLSGHVRHRHPSCAAAPWVDVRCDWSGRPLSVAPCYQVLRSSVVTDDPLKAEQEPPILCFATPILQQRSTVGAHGKAFAAGQVVKGAISHTTTLRVLTEHLPTALYLQVVNDCVPLRHRRL